MKLKITSAYHSDKESIRFTIEFAHLCKLQGNNQVIIHKAKYN